VVHLLKWVFSALREITCCAAMSERSFVAFLFLPTLTLLWRNNTVPNREKKKWRHHEAAKTMRKVRKEIKRNRKPKRVRHKDWTSYNFDDSETLEEIDLPDTERVMPRGEKGRRRASLEQALSVLEQDDDVTFDEVPPVEDVPGLKSRVIEVSSSLCRVDLDGRSLICNVRGSLSAEETGYTNVIAVGDEVVVSENGSGQGVVEAILPRRSVLARPDVFYTHLQQVIVANADQLLIVASWRNPYIWLELIDRYLIAADRCNLQPIICVNKIDLAEDLECPQATLQPYRELGYRVIFTSAITGRGVGKLRKVLSQRNTVLAGLSGVGKSSLLSAVQPGLELRVGQINEQRGEGRHTTTQVVMHRLQRGGFVVDTPGIREFGLSNLRQGELARFYYEIAAAAESCRFGDCSHTHEPGCGVKVAVENGQIAAARYHSYEKIHESLPT
jgi:ribosome biogenesis GTPase